MIWLFIMIFRLLYFDKKKNRETFKEGKDFTSLKYCLDQSADFLLSTKMIDKLPDDSFIK